MKPRCASRCVCRSPALEELRAAHEVSGGGTPLTPCAAPPEAHASRGSALQHRRPVQYGIEIIKQFPFKPLGAKPERLPAGCARRVISDFWLKANHGVGQAIGRL